ncbi:two-component response regulator-like PRR95 isoform X2 [Telopea speciosissima]|uniref:two-component response regulator-like PRR95 isoform X2 n=1 Tax=Telopea speciosissima TaxID=54955 RepID=UPI001CC5CABA|nr:two-component response regulator-like PRR95 isoform X2 [Telopea speciosissima]
MEMVPQVEEEWRDTEKEKESSTFMMKREQFFPRMSLRVLLVESDDSTRQIITALLRKCSYRVAAVPDGLKAWEALKGRPHNVDLILTEVELPSVSGFTLLTLIMEHEICKKIPVIMMSSNDSISMVFKCMMRGAADFLIKPLRKNELRNLWQHVWRRQSSAGDRNLAQRKVEAISENNAASNHSSDYVACTQKNKTSSGKGSDAQSSCTKPDMEAESACMQNLQDCSQPICRSSSLEHENKKEEKSTILGSEVTQSNEASASARFVLGDSYGKREAQPKDVAPENHREDANITGATRGNSNEGTESLSEAIDLIGAFDNRLRWNFGHSYNTVTKEVLFDGIKTLSGSNDKSGCTPLLELSLKRSHLSGSEGQRTDERHTLNHSNASAFSWYNNRKAQSPLPAYNQGPCHTADAPQQNSLTSSVGQSDLAETVIPCHQQVIPAPVPIGGMSFDGLYASYATVLPPMFYESAQLPLRGQSTGSRLEPSTVCLNLSHQPNPETQYEQGCHFQDQNADSSTNQTLREQVHNIEDLEDPSDVSPPTGQSANSCIYNGARSYLNSSGCGSVCNGNNGNVTAVIAARATVECRSGESLFVHDRVGGMDPHCSTHREAALTKFRLKRKDRCYEKKVRYQSRKRLAEQRPRVKGQFVRQASQDLPSAESIITNDLFIA